MTKNIVREKPQEEVKPKQKSSGGNIVTRTIGSVMSGSFLSRDIAVKALPFMFFITLIALFYIANGYYAEEQIRKQNRLTGELKELRSEYIISKSMLATVSTQTAVKLRVLPLGIKESTINPPSIITVEKLPE
ncbi:MAG TPA: FtsL-like putative cell division protein [Bacteroidia bacterium]|nr:FtsL-like putative cell division protein [Bacteroidia bacterium]